MSIKTSGIAFIVLASTSSFALASNYQYEVSGNLDNYETTNDGSKIKDNIYNLTGTYYFSPVETKNHPLAQAAFMERVNNVSLHYHYNPSDYELNTDTARYKDDYNYQSLTAMARLWWFDKFLYTSVGLTESETKITTRSYNSNGNLITRNKYEYHDHAYMQASVGISPFAGLLVYTNFYEATNWSDAINLNAQYTRSLSDSTAIATHIRYSDNDENRRIVVEADYYFTPRLSVGAGYEHGEHYNLGYEWMLRSTYFVTPKIALDATYENYDIDSSIGIGATVRF